MRAASDRATTWLLLAGCLIVGGYFLYSAINQRVTINRQRNLPVPT